MHFIIFITLQLLKSFLKVYFLLYLIPYLINNFLNSSKDSIQVGPFLLHRREANSSHTIDSLVH